MSWNISDNLNLWHVFRYSSPNMEMVNICPITFCFLHYISILIIISPFISHMLSLYSCKWKSSILFQGDKPLFLGQEIFWVCPWSGQNRGHFCFEIKKKKLLKKKKKKYGSKLFTSSHFYYWKMNEKKTAKVILYHSTAPHNNLLHEDWNSTLAQSCQLPSVNCYD